MPKLTAFSGVWVTLGKLVTMNVLAAIFFFCRQTEKSSVRSDTYGELIVIGDTMCVKALFV